MKTNVFILVLLLVASFAQSAEAGDNVLWVENGVPVNTIEDLHLRPELVSDGSGGAIITWGDGIRAQRVDANGDTLWPGSVYIAGGYFPKLVGDGLGGAIIAWDEPPWGSCDVYAQRVDANGNVLWLTGGIPVCTATNQQAYHQIVSAGNGGFIIAWQDSRSGDYDIYAQRVDTSGSVTWTADGEPICTAAGDQTSPQIAADNSGGAIITWVDEEGYVDDIYAQRVDASGNALWTADGEPICTATGEQWYPQIVSDGSEGAVITWCDDRNGYGESDIFTQRVDADGSVLWLADGVPVCAAASDQHYPEMVSDGLGGAVIAWMDYRNGIASDIYAQRVDVNGLVRWTSDGEPICIATGGQWDHKITSDGSGGGIIAWLDYRNTDIHNDYNVYAQRIDVYGRAFMPTNGEPVCTAVDSQYAPNIVSDGSGGAIITWEDFRTHFIGINDIYAQRIHFDPAPQIASIADVPQDQGRQVAIIWDRSYLDEPEYQVIGEYSIWRKYPEGMKWLGRQWDGTLPKELVGPVYRLIEERDPPGQVRTKAWEYIGSVDAHYLESYAYIAPTLWDSSATDAAYFSFFVSAHTTDPFVFYDSLPDSGYSVDDIDPGKTAVTVLTAGGAKGFSAGERRKLSFGPGEGKSSVNTVWLSWEQVTAGEDGSPEQGPVDYRVYCDEPPDFTPGPGNLVTTTAELSYEHTDPRIGDPAANLYYLVTAVDGSGNESAVSNVVGEFDRSLGNVK